MEGWGVRVVCEWCGAPMRKSKGLRNEETARPKDHRDAPTRTPHHPPGHTKGRKGPQGQDGVVGCGWSSVTNS